ncbi:MAG: DUF512 domain-containing protein [Clostridia bacterium]|nr:DUF512 domain-containing protein [Clostridia bacterium]
MAHEVTQVERGSAAERAGLRPGDELLTINGQRIIDVIDYELFICAKSPVLRIMRNGETLDIKVKKSEYAPMGLRFGESLMSRQRDCVNKCVFCFVDQLPKNVRPTLNVKDDDWRMSLMMGNFVTMTNVSDRELERIIARRCHPLYISVHATDPEIRAEMMGQKIAGKIMSQLEKLAAAGLTFHTQAVVCPGINDGEVLERTVKDLAGLRPHALSLALVPVGLTGHREGLYPLKPFDKDDAARILAQADAFDEKYGEGFVFPADELYLLAGRDFPPDGKYGDYDQIENGVGLCRRFASEYEEAWRDRGYCEAREADAANERHYAIACGVSVAAFLRELVEEFPVPGARVDVYAVENRFFGPTVTVSGLLTGSDLIRAMKGVECDEVLISQTMLREMQDVFLDDMTLNEVSKALAKPVTAIPDAQRLVERLSGEG